MHLGKTKKDDEMLHFGQWEGCWQPQGFTPASDPFMNLSPVTLISFPAEDRIMGPRTLLVCVKNSQVWGKKIALFVPSCVSLQQVVTVEIMLAAGSARHGHAWGHGPLP